MHVSDATLRRATIAMPATYLDLAIAFDWAWIKLAHASLWLRR